MTPDRAWKPCTGTRGGKKGLFQTTRTTHHTNFKPSEPDFLWRGHPLRTAGRGGAWGHPPRARTQAQARAHARSCRNARTHARDWRNARPRSISAATEPPAPPEPPPGAPTGSPQRPGSPPAGNGAPGARTGPVGAPGSPARARTGNGAPEPHGAPGGSPRSPRAARYREPREGAPGRPKTSHGLKCGGNARSVRRGAHPCVDVHPLPRGASPPPLGGTVRYRRIPAVWDGFGAIPGIFSCFFTVKNCQGLSVLILLQKHP